MVKTISPLERVAPTIDFNPMSELQESIGAIEARVGRTKKAMKLIRVILSNQERMDFKLMEEYQDLNEQLRVLEVFKANFRYHKRRI